MQWGTQFLGSRVHAHEVNPDPCPDAIKGRFKAMPSDQVPTLYFLSAMPPRASRRSRVYHQPLKCLLTFHNNFTPQGPRFRTSELPTRPHPDPTHPGPRIQHPASSPSLQSREPIADHQARQFHLIELSPLIGLLPLIRSPPSARILPTGLALQTHRPAK
jgi:hypothetical protein